MQDLIVMSQKELHRLEIIQKLLEKRLVETEASIQLDISVRQIICANTSQAKGRVERANRTLQDRLVKKMRLRNISSM